MTKATVYLIHFDRPYKHARHYVGYTTDLDQRMHDHRTGQGARLLAVLITAQIGWGIARTWAFDTAKEARVKERQLKGHGAGRHCPICQEITHHDGTRTR